MWTLDGVRIYVDGFDIGGDKIQAELNPLGGGSIYHFFGYEDEKLQLSGVVIGDTDRDDILAMYKDDGAFELIGDTGTLGDFLVKNVQFKRTSAVRQNVRGDLSDTAPVYTVRLELMESL